MMIALFMGVKRKTERLVCECVYCVQYGISHTEHRPDCPHVPVSYIDDAVNCSCPQDYAYNEDMSIPMSVRYAVWGKGDEPSHIDTILHYTKEHTVKERRTKLGDEMCAWRKLSKSLIELSDADKKLIEHAPTLRAEVLRLREIITQNYDMSIPMSIPMSVRHQVRPTRNY